MRTKISAESSCSIFYSPLKLRDIPESSFRAGQGGLGRGFAVDQVNAVLSEG